MKKVGCDAEEKKKGFDESNKTGTRIKIITGREFYAERRRRESLKILDLKIYVQVKIKLPPQNPSLLYL